MEKSSKVTTFRNRFSTLVDESEKTTIDLAKELHVSNQTISAWKTGTRSPKEPTIIAIAKHFGVNVAWLMGFDVDKWDTRAVLENAFKDAGYEPMSKEARIISGGIDKMPPERREQALKILQVAFTEFADYFKEDNHET